MTIRDARIVSLALAVLAWAVPAHAAQELANGSAQAFQIAGAFPRSEPGPLERQARPITPENPIPRRTRTVRPSYPPEAATVGARASVRLRATVDHLGTVGEVRTVGVPVLGAMAPPGPADGAALTAGLLALVQSAKDAVGQWLYDPPADAPIAFDVVIGFMSAGDGEVTAQNPVSQPLVPLDSVPHVGGPGISRPPTKVKHVNPIYPAAAREAKISGVVVLEMHIDADGRVLDAQVLRSIPELDAAALEAVRQWEFEPTIVDGVPTPVTMTATIQFSLQ